MAPQSFCTKHIILLCHHVNQTEFYLDYLLKNSGLSKNKFCQRAEIQRSQLKGYINNSITHLDTDVLVRICRTFGCSIADLLEYILPDNL